MNAVISRRGNGIWLRSAVTALLVLHGLSCSNGTTLPTPSEGSTDLALWLRSELARVIVEQKATTEEFWEVVPASDLGFEPQTRQLTWLYGIRGDYDLNGEVNVADLAPLGSLYGSQVQQGGGVTPSRLQWVDGDMDGQIYLPDLVPIGRAFGKVVSGYRVLGAKTLDPFDSGGSFSVVGEIPLSAGTPGWPPSFVFTVPEGVRFVQLAPLNAPDEMILKRALDTENPGDDGFVDFTDPRTGDTYRVVAGVVMVNCKLPLDHPKVLAFIEAEKLAISESIPEFMYFVAYLPPETTLEDAVGNWPSEYPDVVIAVDPDSLISPHV
jgi:hypothetical protein